MRRQALIKEFDDLFAMAAEERSKRPEFVKVKKTYPWSGRVVEETDPAWAIFERETMLAHVNEIRVKAGLQPATMTMIEQADRHAAGHVDYAHKFALYCAEISLGETTWTS